MFARLRSAWRVLVSGASAPAPACARCAEYKQDRDYWREREERTADALLNSKGVMSRVAAPPKPATPTPMASIARGMGITEIDSRQSKQPGQGAETRGTDRSY